MAAPRFRGFAQKGRGSAPAAAEPLVRQRSPAVRSLILREPDRSLAIVEGFPAKKAFQSRRVVPREAFWIEVDVNWVNPSDYRPNRTEQGSFSFRRRGGAARRRARAPGAPPIPSDASRTILGSQGGTRV